MDQNTKGDKVLLEHKDAIPRCPGWHRKASKSPAEEQG